MGSSSCSWVPFGLASERASHVADYVRCSKCERETTRMGAALSHDEMCSLNERALLAYIDNGGKSYETQRAIMEWK